MMDPISSMMDSTARDTVSSNVITSDTSTSNTISMANLFVMSSNLGTVGACNILIIAPKLESQARGINVSMAEQQDGSKPNLCKNIQDTIEDTLAIRGNNVAALG
jgi:hypothetical protein